MTYWSKNIATIRESDNMTRVLSSISPAKSVVNKNGRLVNKVLMNPLVRSGNNIVRWEKVVMNLDPISYYDRDFCFQIFDAYMRDTRESLNIIAWAARRDDYPEITSQAHAIKGNAGMLGLVSMAKVACELQELAKRWEQGKFADPIKRLGQEFLELRKLRVLIAEYKSSK